MNIEDTIIYHNPKCSKSRQTLELLRAHGIEPRIIEYLKTPPSINELHALIAKLKITPQMLIRTKEETYKNIRLPASTAKDEEWLQLLAEHPVLIERPIVVMGQRAVIGRPPENVLSLLK